MSLRSRFEAPFCKAALGAVATLLICGVAWGEVPADERLQVTDPALLARMGFEEGARVYLWTRGSHAPDAQRLLWSEGLGFDSEPRSSVVTGGGQTNHRAVAGSQFNARTTNFVRGSLGEGDLYCATGSTDGSADGHLDIHNGAELTFARFWGDDACGSENLEVILFEFCQSDFFASAVTATALGSSESNDMPGDFVKLITFNPPVPVDTRSCVYTFRAIFGNGATCPCGSTLRLYKARAEYTSASEGAVHPVAPPF